MFLDKIEFKIEQITEQLVHHNILIPTESVFSTQTIGEVAHAMDQNAFGLLAVVDQSKSLLGVVSDGDIRRLIVKTQGLLTSTLAKTADEIMNKNAKCVSSNQTLKQVLKICNTERLLAVPIVDSPKIFLGMLDVAFLSGSIACEL